MESGSGFDGPIGTRACFLSGASTESSFKLTTRRATKTVQCYSRPPYCFMTFHMRCTWEPTAGNFPHLKLPEGLNTIPRRCFFSPRRSWTLLSRGRTLLSRGLDPQIPRVLRDQSSCERSVWAVGFALHSFDDPRQGRKRQDLFRGCLGTACGSDSPEAT